MRFIPMLRLLSLIEGVSTLILFGIAMPLKYAAGMPLAVTIAGTVHGALFTALALMLLIAIRQVPLPDFGRRNRARGRRSSGRPVPLRPHAARHAVMVQRRL